MSDKPTCPVELDIVEPRPTAVDLASGFSLRLAIVTAPDRDLSGARYLVFEGDRKVGEGELSTIRRHDPNSDDCDPRNGPVDTRDKVGLELVSPRQEGEFSWRIVLPAQEVAGIRLREAEVPFSFKTARHRTSLAVWDVPTPVVAGGELRFKVGAKCTAGCDLSGHRIDILDEAARPVACVDLRDAVLAEAQGLYWAEVSTVAPCDHVMARWQARFAARALELPHTGASTEFSFMATPPPRHKVCVRVVETETQAPVAGAQVRLGDFRVATDRSGSAHLVVPGGRQRLFIWEAGHEIPEQFLDIDRDLEVVVQAKTLPIESPYDRWDG
jgi:hypothetical protein